MAINPELEPIILSIIIGTLAAIVYSLRVLILLERRISRMDENIELLTRKILEEEVKIEKVEEDIKREEDLILKKGKRR